LNYFLSSTFLLCTYPASGLSRTRHGRILGRGKKSVLTCHYSQEHNIFCLASSLTNQWLRFFDRVICKIVAKLHQFLDECGVPAYLMLWEAYSGKTRDKLNYSFVLLSGFCVC